MQIEHVKINFEKKSETLGFKYKLFPPASDDLIQETENKLNVKFPDQVAIFYKHYNGMIVEDPQLSVLSLENLSIRKNLKINFAIFDGQYQICFDTTSINEADQWNIINDQTNYLITLTMASFWTNKIWNWIVKRRCIWEKENKTGPSCMDSPVKGERSI